MFSYVSLEQRVPRGCTLRAMGEMTYRALKEPSPEFDHVSDQLARSDYTTIAERNRLFTRALELAMQDSARIWLVDRTSIWPRRAEVKVVADLAGGISGSLLWPYTIRYEGRTGGTVRIGVPNMLPVPWNPVGGSNFIFDTAYAAGNPLVIHEIKCLAGAMQNFLNTSSVILVFGWVDS